MGYFIHMKQLLIAAFIINVTFSSSMIVAGNLKSEDISFIIKFTAEEAMRLSIPPTFMSGCQTGGIAGGAATGAVMSLVNNSNPSNGIIDTLSGAFAGALIGGFVGIVIGTIAEDLIAESEEAKKISHNFDKMIYLIKKNHPEFHLPKIE